MSKLSEALRHVFHANTGESAASAFSRYLGEHQDDIREYAAEIVTALNFTTLDSEAKRVVARELIRHVAQSALGITLPDWVVNWLIEETVAILKSRNKDQHKQTAPSSGSAPSASVPQR